MGRSIGQEGYGRYARVASAPEWAGLHDPYWQGMNQKDLRTIYPPVAEWIFSAAGGVWYHPMALKAMFIFCQLEQALPAAVDKTENCATRLPCHSTDLRSGIAFNLMQK